MTTPYQRHRENCDPAKRSREAAPCGFRIIESCEDCQQAWLMPCTLDSEDSYPVTLPHYMARVNASNAEHDAKVARMQTRYEASKHAK